MVLEKNEIAPKRGQGCHIKIMRQTMQSFQCQSLAIGSMKYFESEA